MHDCTAAIPRTAGVPFRRRPSRPFNQLQPSGKQGGSCGAVDPPHCFQLPCEFLRAVSHNGTHVNASCPMFEAVGSQLSPCVLRQASRPPPPFVVHFAAQTRLQPGMGTFVRTQQKGKQVRRTTCHTCRHRTMSATYSGWRHETVVTCCSCRASVHHVPLYCPEREPCAFDLPGTQP